MPTAAEIRRLEREADAIIARHRRRADGAEKIRRIDRQPAFDEKAGRAAYDCIPGRGAVRPSFEEDEIVPTADGRDEDYFGEAVPRFAAMDEGLHAAFAHVLFDGRLTAGAVLSRLAGVAVRAGLLSQQDAAKLCGKSARTIRRYGRRNTE